MITYERLWKTMERKGITQYCLLKEHKVSESTLHRLRKGLPVTTTTLNYLCEILDCELEEVCHFVRP